MKKLLFILILSCLSISLYSCSSSSYTSNYEDDGMSYRYKTDSEYRHNVDSVAEIYGKTPKEMEDSVENFLDATR